jgi:hypothetical protein
VLGQYNITQIMEKYLQMTKLLTQTLETAAIKKIVAAEASRTSRYIDNICSCGNKNFCSAFRNSNCTDVSASSVGFGTASLDFERYCTRSVTAWNRPNDKLNISSVFCFFSFFVFPYSHRMLKK